MAQITITSALQATRSSQPYRKQWTQCPTDGATALQNKFANIEQFVGAYSTSMQDQCAKNVDRCLFGNAPELSVVAAAYGEANAKRFIVAQMANLARYCGGNAQSISVDQVQDLAGKILTEYYFLNAAELLLFVYRFKCGMYGKFYKSFEPLTVMDGLRQFIVWRGEKIAKHEQELEKEEREQNRAIGISREQYLLLKERAAHGDAQARALLQAPTHTQLTTTN